ncbi:DNA (cytosine-5-)-methyltransferase [Aliidiomarina shirensis]|uniref:Cytosine-specific methyltransferase n=1 Tax=Aliidiomarina shirensis TaxID=1048642 RepID=A0A432WWI7_9GAMM|nr:DNA cytosine methyltransferase [Aliidiomarina shirensis]RUO38136.1 DNA (cytosine-5-)-methyltransferase [Aliidiomarina shirensis]
MKITAVDLFCGVGGLTHGFVKAGVEVTAGYDLDEACRYAYEKNNFSTFYQRDISEVSPNEIATLFPKNSIKLLAGCAPCQPFSKYTQKKPKDDRWGLLYHFSRLISGVNPDLVTMENVPGVCKHRVYQDFKAHLIDSGYYVTDTTVFCPDYGLPQRRLRLVLLASKLGPVELIKPTHTVREYRTVKDSISHLPSIHAGQGCKHDRLHISAGLSQKNLSRIKHSKPGGTWRDWPEELLSTCHTKKSGQGYSSVYGRMEWSLPSPTITTQCYGFGNGRFGHPSQDRAISLREAAILQSFPDEYEFLKDDDKLSMSTLGRLIGNAVPVVLGEVIAKSFQQHLNAVNCSNSTVIQSNLLSN